MRAATVAVVALAGACQVTAGGKQWSAGGGGATPSSSSSAGEDEPIRTGLEPGAAYVEPPRSDAKSAAAIGGLPGGPCQPERAERLRDAGMKEPCWDPPGTPKAVARRELVRGMAVAEAPDPTMLVMHAVYLFDMPRTAKPTHGYVQLQDHDGTWWPYHPYATAGFAPPVVPDLHGKPLADVLALLDAIDMPFVVDVTWDHQCEGDHETVCAANDVDGDWVELRVAARIKHPGTGDEQRQIPDGLEGRPVADVIEQLEQLGFVSIAVVEKDLPCERGVVCAAPRAGWHPTRQVIELEVRRGTK